MSFNILFTASGRRVSLIRAFKQALADLAFWDVQHEAGKVICSDITLSAPGLHVGDVRVAVPIDRDIGRYLTNVLTVCEMSRVKLLVPLIDTELEFLATHVAKFADIGTKVLISSPEFIAMCADKVHTAGFFRSIGLDVPKVYSYEEAEPMLNKENTQPFFIKPRFGSGSKGAKAIYNQRQLACHYFSIHGALIQEFIDGEEYTIDVLLGLDGELGCIVPRHRMEVRNGEVSKARTVKDAEIIEAVKAMVPHFKGARGPITIQCFKRKGKPLCFTEINARFGGGYPLSYRAGANYPKRIIQQCMDGEPLAYQEDWAHDLVMLRYDDEIILTGAKMAWGAM